MFARGSLRTSMSAGSSAPYNDTTQYITISTWRDHGIHTQLSCMNS